MPRQRERFDPPAALSAGRLPSAPPPLPALHPILAAQQVLGNRAVARAFEEGGGLLQRQGPGPDGAAPRLTLPEFENPFAPKKPPSLLPELRLEFHLTPADREAILAYLAQRQLKAGAGFRPFLDGQATTLDAVVDAALGVPLFRPPRREVEALVGEVWSQKVRAALTQLPPQLGQVTVPNPLLAAPPAAAGPAAAAVKPLTFSAGVNYAWHVNLTGGPGTSSDRTFQIGIGEDAPLQRIFQVSYNLDTRQAQVLVGGQATADKDLIEGWLKLSGFLQVLAGVGWTGTPASGTFSVLQPSAGGQLTLSFGEVKFVQVALQVSGSVTAASGQPTTAEANVTPTVTFTLPGPKREKRVDTEKLTGIFEVRDWVEKARYSEIERLPTAEKERLTRILLGGSAVIARDVDAIARIWRAFNSEGERQGMRQILTESLLQIENEASKASLEKLLKEAP